MKLILTKTVEETIHGETSCKHQSCKHQVNTLGNRNQGRWVPLTLTRSGYIDIDPRSTFISLMYN